MITVEQYFMGRDREYPAELTPAILACAEELVGRVNLLLECARLDGVEPGVDQKTLTAVASGWRPAAINDRTRNAAAASKHLTGQAVDLQDTTDRRLAAWCVLHIDALETAGLYMERPQWTGGRDPWVHLQSVPPKSGKRVYIPSSAPATALALAGEEALA